MAKALDIVGRRFGQLVVVGSAGRVRYGGRVQGLWSCVCDCGERIDLPSAKLPYSEASIASARRAGRLIYTCCETCRQKTCPLCGTRFLYSHSSHICPSPICQQEAARWRDDYWHSVHADRYRSDSAYRARVREYHNAYYDARAEEVQARRRELREALSDSGRDILAEKKARQYKTIKSNPEKYAHRMAGIRRRKSELLAERFFSVADDIIKKRDQ